MDLSSLGRQIDLTILGQHGGLTGSGQYLDPTSVNKYRDSISLKLHIHPAIFGHHIDLTVLLEFGVKFNCMYTKVNKVKYNSQYRTSNWCQLS